MLIYRILLCDSKPTNPTHSNRPYIFFFSFPIFFLKNRFSLSTSINTFRIQFTANYVSNSIALSLSSLSLSLFSNSPFVPNPLSAKPAMSQVHRSSQLFGSLFPVIVLFVDLRFRSSLLLVKVPIFSTRDGLNSCFSRSLTRFNGGFWVSDLHLGFLTEKFVSCLLIFVFDLQFCWKKIQFFSRRWSESMFFSSS